MNKKSSWIIQYLTDSRTVNNEPFFHIKGRIVCNTVWILVHGIGKYKYYKARSLYLSGLNPPLHASTGTEKPQIFVKLLVYYLEKFIEEECELLPVNREVMIP